MTATGKNGPATQPGPRSYTTALMRSLHTLRERKSFGFSTHELNQEIDKCYDFSSFSKVISVLPNNTGTRHIHLSPLKKEDKTKASNRPSRKAGYLDLRIFFRDRNRLEDEEVQDLARHLSHLSKPPEAGGVEIADIEWVNYEPCKESRVFKKLVLLLRIAWLFSMAKTRFRKRKLALKRKREDDEQDGDSSSSKRRQTEEHATDGPSNWIAKGISQSLPLTPESSCRDFTPTL